MRQERRVLTENGSPQDFTAEPTWDLICGVADALDRIRRQRQRDPWWFLQEQRVRAPEPPPDGLVWSSPPAAVDLRRGVIGQHFLFGRDAPGLSCAIRVISNPSLRRSPLVLVDWRDMRRSRGAAAGDRADAGLLTIELGVDQRHGPTGIFTQRAVPGASLAQRRSYWRDYQRWRREPNRTTEWEILPAGGASARWRRAAAVLMLVYLVQRNMVECSPDAMPRAWIDTRRFLRGCGARDNGEAADAFLRLCQSSGKSRYAFPERLEGLVTYIRRVIWDLRRRGDREIPMNIEEIQERAERRRRGRVPAARRPREIDSQLKGLRSVDQAALELRVRRETIYRWARKEEYHLTLFRGRRFLDPSAFKRAKALVEHRKARRELTRLLTKQYEKRLRRKPGKSRNPAAAAKKTIQRGLHAGMTLAEIARRARASQPRLATYSRSAG